MSALQEKSDQELITACLGGSVLAWETLIQRYRSLIYSIARKYHFSESDAADIFQATCVLLLEKLPDLRHHEKFRSWLIVAVGRQCWHARQRLRREVPIPDIFNEGAEEFGWQPPTTAQPADEMILELERRHQVQRAFVQLPAHCQQLLEYLILREPPASYREIAARMGINFNSISPTRSRCLEKFKFFFDRAYGSDKEPPSHS